MAAFGATCLVVAPITAEAENTITYGAGVRVEHLRRADITYNWDERPMYGDNQTAEYLRRLIDADVQIETTELDGDIAVVMGLEKAKGTGYTLKTRPATPCGVGFIQTMIVNGVKEYRAVWLHKVQLIPGDETAQTKEDTITWGASSVRGKAHRVMLDESGEAQIRDYRVFGNALAASLWLYERANVANDSTRNYFSSFDIEGVTWDVEPTPYALNYLASNNIPLTGHIDVLTGNETSALTFAKGDAMRTLMMYYVELENTEGVTPEMAMDANDVITWGAAGTDSEKGITGTFAVNFQGDTVDGERMEGFMNVKVTRVVKNLLPVRSVSLSGSAATSIVFDEPIDVGDYRFALHYEGDYDTSNASWMMLSFYDEDDVFLYVTNLFVTTPSVHVQDYVIESMNIRALGESTKIARVMFKPADGQDGASGFMSKLAMYKN